MSTLEFSRTDNVDGLAIVDLEQPLLGEQTSASQGHALSAKLYPQLSTVTSSLSNASGTTTGDASDANGGANLADGDLLEELIVPLYATIFVLAVIGNLLVVVTLAKNKRMRTVTNVYLLNLALSDLLLGVFCIPFTLLGQILKNFVFGTTMCRLIPYFQAVSVSVSVWTLVAISLERYFAICRPLKSRRWQTRCHACKMIGVVWAASLAWNAPILFVSSLKEISGGRQKCREDWPSIATERAFNIFLDVILLVVPLIIMTLAYSLIVTRLRRREIQHSSSCQRQLERTGSSATVNGVFGGNSGSDSNSGKLMVTPLRQHTRLLRSSGYLQGVQRVTSHGLMTRNKPATTGKCQRTNSSRRRAEAVKLWLMKGMLPPPGTGTPRVVTCKSRSTTSLTATTPRRRDARGVTRVEVENAAEESEKESVSEEHHHNDATYTFSRHAIRSNYMDKSIEAKKKVIVMLCVVMLTFFVCWAPLYVVHTWYLFAPRIVYGWVGRTGISLIQLLAYWSCCCNPFIYCYMNRNFRQAVKSVSYEFFSNYCGRGHEVIVGSGSAARNGVTQGVNSEVSGNDSTIYMGRASLMARTEVVILEAEDRV